jgi:chromosomal replication initiation ATPase DnaA
MEEMKSVPVIVGRSSKRAALFKVILTREQKLEKIKNVLYAETKYSLEQVSVKHGGRGVSDTKKIYAFFIKEYTDMFLKSIADYMGGGDHSSIIYLINKFNNLYDTDRRFREKADLINKAIKKELGIKSRKELGRKI